MFTIVYALLIVAVGILAGSIGSLVGLGGAIILTPILTLVFGVPLPYAAGAGIVSTVATSSGSGIAYIQERMANVRLGISLEMGTTLGAIAGALLAGYAYMLGLDSLMFMVFGISLTIPIYSMVKKRKARTSIRADSTTKTFKLRGKYYDQASGKGISYIGRRWYAGEAVMTVAGLISGLLGIGSGVLKVMAMNDVMGIPEKVSTTTSSFIIGVTALVGSAIYWHLGYIQPLITGAAIIGVATGAFFTSRYLNRIKESRLTDLFLVLLILISIEMIMRGIGIGF